MAGRTATLWSLICRDSCETHRTYFACVCAARGAPATRTRRFAPPAVCTEKPPPLPKNTRPTLGVGPRPTRRSTAPEAARGDADASLQPLGPVRTAIRSCSVVSTVQRMRLKNCIRRASDLSPLPPRPGPKGTFARDRISCTDLQFRANAQPLPDRRLVLELEAASVEASWACRDRDGR